MQLKVEILGVQLLNVFAQPVRSILLVWKDEYKFDEPKYDLPCVN